MPKFPIGSKVRLKRDWMKFHDGRGYRKGDVCIVRGVSHREYSLKHPDHGCFAWVYERDLELAYPGICPHCNQPLPKGGHMATPKKSTSKRPVKTTKKH